MRLVLAISLVCSSAFAADKTLAVAAGDCRAPVLVQAMTEFQGHLGERLKAELYPPDLVLEILRPRANRSLEDLQRQIESARTLHYNGQTEKALELTKQAEVELEKVSLSLKPWATLADALLLESLLHRTLSHKAEALEAWRRILRIEPTFAVDTNQYTPSFVQAFEAYRKELGRARKVQLEVVAAGGAEVHLDGRPMGKAPLKLQLLAGDYKVALLADDRVSFAHVARLTSKPELVQIDLAYEGAVAPTTPVCINAASEAEAKTLAIKLAASVGVERIIIMRLASKPSEPAYFRAALMQGTDEERGGGVRQSALRDLAEFLVTGKASEQLVMGTGKPAELKPPEPKPVETKPAETKPVEVRAPDQKPDVKPTEPAKPVVAQAPPKPETKPVTPVEPPKSSLPVGHATTRGPLPRIIGLALVGLGVGFAVGGVVVYVDGAGARKDLEDSLTANKHIALNSEEKAFTAMAAIEKNRALYGTLFGVGGGLAIAGALMALLLPPGDVVVVADLAPHRAGLGFTTTF